MTLWKGCDKVTALPEFNIAAITLNNHPQLIRHATRRVGHRRSKPRRLHESLSWSPHLSNQKVYSSRSSADRHENANAQFLPQKYGEKSIPNGIYTTSKPAYVVPHDSGAPRRASAILATGVSRSDFEEASQIQLWD